MTQPWVGTRESITLRRGKVKVLGSLVVCSSLLRQRAFGCDRARASWLWCPPVPVATGQAPSAVLHSRPAPGRLLGLLLAFPLASLGGGAWCGCGCEYVVVGVEGGGLGLCWLFVHCDGWMRRGSGSSYQYVDRCMSRPERVDLIVCSQLRGCGLEQVLVSWWCSIQCGVLRRRERVWDLFPYCVVEREVEGGRVCFWFRGACWAFVCFVGSCAEWGVAEGAIELSVSDGSFCSFLCCRRSLRTGV